MFLIKEFHARINSTPIIKGVSLEIAPGEVHAIMGPNGSGKSTLANCIMGNPVYAVTSGSIELDGEDLTLLKPEKRAHRGIFLAFQYPKEIPGVSVANFLKMALSAMRKARNQPEISHLEFRKLLKMKLGELKLEAGFMNRSLNDGFSGGEKKKMEMLQMALLQPRMAILDETDSGLDVDALKIVARGINALRDPSRSILLITHYQRILHYVKPDFVHIMRDGVIAASGGPELCEKIEKEGYDWISHDAIPSNA